MTVQKDTPPPCLPDNTTGRLIYDTLRSLAEKLWAAGKKATGDFASENFPACKLVRNEYASGKQQYADVYGNVRHGYKYVEFRRIIKLSDGDHMLIIYDYLTKTTTAALLVQSPINDEYIAGKHENIDTARLDLFY